MDVESELSSEGAFELVGSEEDSSLFESVEGSLESIEGSVVNSLCSLEDGEEGTSGPTQEVKSKFERAKTQSILEEETLRIRVHYSTHAHEFCKFAK